MFAKIFTRAIWILSIVSLLTDISSEMLYPIMPLYLKSIGFTVFAIGVLEGFAEAIAGFSKGYFGKMSDESGRRAPFVNIGYALSSISKPMMAVFVFPVWIFLSRTIDRLGKGIRTSARDAILSDESTPENRGKVFGFHRGMDTLGAAIGPVLALIYLQYYPGDYKNLFYLAFFPAIAGVIFTFFLKDKNPKKDGITSPRNFFSFLNYRKSAPVEYKKLVSGLIAFTLFNSSDVFLLLMIKNLGFTDDKVIMIYIFYNLVYALASLPVGMIADKIGLKNNYIIGLVIFCFVYAAMSFDPGIEFLFVIFFCYGLYAASTEGISKAWITKITDKKDTATAIGFYTGINSIFAVLSSSLAGMIWYTFGPKAMFVFSSAGCLLVVIYFIANFGRNSYSSR